MCCLIIDARAGRSGRSCYRCPRHCRSERCNKFTTGGHDPSRLVADSGGLVTVGHSACRCRSVATRIVTPMLLAEYPWTPTCMFDVPITPGRHRAQPASSCRHPRAELRRGEIATFFRLFGFELQGRCSAFTSWRARERDPKTFSLATHNQGTCPRACDLRPSAAFPNQP